MGQPGPTFSRFSDMLIAFGVHVRKPLDVSGSAAHL